MNNPVSVLSAIARECGCTFYDIEATLENINDRAGLVPRPMIRKRVAEERLDVIRAWLGTPEAHSVIDDAQAFMRQMRAA